MVIRKNLDKKNALISVYNKKNLKFLCENLEEYNYNFISSGTTAKKIRSIGFKCRGKSGGNLDKENKISVKSIFRL